MKSNRIRKPAVLEPLERRRLMTVYNVTNIWDAGTGSFRQAILDATVTPGNTIHFTINSGPTKISLLTALPTVTNSVVIDATTLAGYNGRPLLELDGTAVTAGYGLWLKAPNVTVRGFVIHSFGLGPNGRSAIRIDNGNDTVQNCFLGTSADGLTSLPNGFSGLEAGAGSNRIGGTGLHDGNVISGNASAGIFLVNSPGNTIQGNYIGVGSDGSKPLPNGTNGISCAYNCPGTIIGGTVPGSRNVISNNYDGIYLSPNSGSAIIQGNYIGTDAQGLVAEPNMQAGIEVQAANVTIGGTAPGAGNLISGNAGSGIALDGSDCTGVTVQGNSIGTNAPGRNPLANALGISLLSTTHGNQIGGTTPAARNLISGNSTNVLSVHGANSNTFQGNYIGTDYSGLNALPNQGDSSINTVGILLQGSDIVNNLIGGTMAGAANIIAGLHGDGILLQSASQNTIQNNIIGFVAADGVRSVGNDGNGINIMTYGGATGVAIGNIITGNTIRSNGMSGIVAFAGTNNRMTGNAISGNGRLAIDLGGGGVPIDNDLGDADFGSNDLQNFPVRSSFNTGNIGGTLNSIARKTYSLDFYWSANLDAAGYSQGEYWIGSTNVVTNDNGDGSFAFTPAAYFSGGYLSATATDPAGSTSEFSGALTISNAGATNLYLKKVDGLHAGVWINSATPGVGTPIRQWLLSQTAPFVFGGGLANDRLTLDFSAGNTLPISGIGHDGGDGVNSVTFIGTSANDILTDGPAGMIFSNSVFGNVPISIANVQSLQFKGGSGGSDSVNLTNGTYTLDADTPIGTPNVSVTVQPGTVVAFATDQHLASLTLNGGIANLSTARHSMFLNGLSIINNGLLDIANSFLYLNNTTTSFSTVKAYLDAAYNLYGATNLNAPYAGDYNGGSGITSSLAKASYASDMVVGIGYYNGALQNPNNPDSAGQIVGPDSNSGHGTGIALNQILIRPTLTGDFNGDGVVNSYDISLFNSYGLFNGGPTPLGWQAGDLNGDGLVNVRDVTVFNSVGNFNSGAFPPPPALATASAAIVVATPIKMNTVRAVALLPPKSHRVLKNFARRARHENMTDHGRRVNSRFAR